jgi:hypothetical protein
MLRSYKTRPLTIPPHTKLSLIDNVLEALRHMTDDIVDRSDVGIEFSEEDDRITVSLTDGSVWALRADCVKRGEERIVRVLVE